MANKVLQGYQVNKYSTGIEGMDAISRGGLPLGRTTLIAGGPGSGKTIFALQTLAYAAAHDESAVFVAFEEPSAHILENARSFGWNLDDLVHPKRGKPRLAFVDAQVSPDLARTGQFDLLGLLAAVQAQAEAIGATRIVFDAVDVLLTLVNDPMLERQELYRINQWLRANEFTGMITARLSPDDTQVEREYTFLQFMCDCVIMLRHYIAERIALRSLRVVKYRGSSFLANEFPMAFGNHGIVVADMGSETQPYQAPKARISTGIGGLDQMLSGGFFRGASILVTGAPGTAKTTLAGAFADATCRRGERVLYIAFDENELEIVRNLQSVNLSLQPHIDSGHLIIQSLRTESKSSEEHLITIRHLMAELKPHVLIIDPISALYRAGGEISPLGAAHRLLRIAKNFNITFLGTSVIDAPDTQSEQTQMQISTMSDIWMHLSYIVRGGERNRSLTIIKARGTRHSNQVRELLLGDEGISLTDVYTIGGEVLMGTARWEKERSVRQQQELMRVQVQEKERELALLEAQTQTQIELLGRELRAQRLELEAVRRTQQEQEAEWTSSQETLRKLRGGQANSMAKSKNTKGKRAARRSRSAQRKGNKKT